MTHFVVTVAVRPDVEDIEGEVERLLAPYDENIQVPRYKDRVDASELGLIATSVSRSFKGNDRTYRPTLQKRWTEEEPSSPANRRHEYAPEGERIVGEALERWEADWEGYQKTRSRWQESIAALYSPVEIVHAYNKYWDYKEDPELYVDDVGAFRWSTYNPNSEWDWWVIGGRWSGWFRGQDGKATDIIQVGDIDWNEMLESQKEERRQYYQAVSERSEGLNGVLDWRTGETVDDISLEEYVERAAILPTATAFVDASGWYKNGRNGWWGMTGIDAPMTAEEWRANYHRWVTALPKTATLVSVDCHI